jgi:hypothetical protein
MAAVLDHDDLVGRHIRKHIDLAIRPMDLDFIRLVRTPSPNRKRKSSWER